MTLNGFLLGMLLLLLFSVLEQSLEEDEFLNTYCWWSYSAYWAAWVWLDRCLAKLELADGC